METFTKSTRHGLFKHFTVRENPKLMGNEFHIRGSFQIGSERRNGLALNHRRQTSQSDSENTLPLVFDKRHFKLNKLKSMEKYGRGTPRDDPMKQDPSNILIRLDDYSKSNLVGRDNGRVGATKTRKLTNKEFQDLNTHKIREYQLRKNTISNPKSTQMQPPPSSKGVRKLSRKGSQKEEPIKKDESLSKSSVSKKNPPTRKGTYDGTKRTFTNNGVRIKKNENPPLKKRIERKQSFDKAGSGPSQKSSRSSATGKRRSTAGSKKTDNTKMSTVTSFKQLQKSSSGYKHDTQSMFGSIRVLIEKKEISNNDLMFEDKLDLRDSSADTISIDVSPGLKCRAILIRMMMTSTNILMLLEKENCNSTHLQRLLKRR